MSRRGWFLVWVTGLVVFGGIGLSLFVFGGSSDSPESSSSGDLRRTDESPAAPDILGAASGSDDSQKKLEIARASADEAPPPVDLDHCDRDLDLFGVVVDSKGAGIAGAKVETILHPWRRTVLLESKSYFKVETGPGTVSSTDGSFAIRLKRGDLVELRASHPGFATRSLPNAMAGQRVSLVLPPASTLRVVVKDEKGKGVPEVQVHFWRQPSAGDERDGVTDAGGACVFEVGTGKGTVRLEHTVLGEPGWQKVDVAMGKETLLEVTMPAGRTLRGKIVDATTNKPIAGATIGENWVMGRAVKSDAEGNYTIVGYTGIGSSDVHVTAEGYGRQGKEVPKQGDLDFALEPADDAKGRLLDPEKRPLPGVTVSFFASDDFSPQGQQIDSGSCVTASDGTFHLTSLRHDMRVHTLAVQAKGYGRYLLDFENHPDRSGGAETIELGDIIVPAARAIEGVVLGQDGKALAGVEVIASGENSDRGRLRSSAAPRSIADFYGRSETRRTDDLGRFRFPDLSPGSYDLKVRIEGRPESVTSVTLGNDRDLLGVEIRVDGGVDLLVRVVDESGAPVPDVIVSINAASYVQTRTDGTGLAVMHGLPGSATWVNVWADDDRFADPTSVVPAGQELRIVLHAASEIAGKVVDEAGQPLPGMQIAVIDTTVTGGRTTIRAADENGQFAIRQKAGARVDLLLSGRKQTLDPRGFINFEEGDLRGELKGIVAPAKDLVLVARKVEKKSSLAFRVVLPDGKPAMGARVQLGESTSPGFLVGHDVDAEGKVRVDGLPATKHTAHAEPALNGGGDWIVSEFVDVEPNTAEVTLTLRTGLRWSGRVIDKSGVAISGVGVSAMIAADNRYLFSGTTDTNGRFTLVVLGNQHYAVRAFLRSSDGSKARMGSIPDAVPEAGEVTMTLDP